MAIDTSVPRSRRALLAGGIGGLAAVAASTLGRPPLVSATDGEIIHVGDDLTATSVTKITQTEPYTAALECVSDAGTGVWGRSETASGVAGASTSYRGVAGSSDSGDGVAGSSGSGRGVYGKSVSSDGVAGSSSSGRGVSGVSSSGDGVVGSSGGSAKSGVYGYTTVSGGFGVFGRNKGTGSTGALGAGVSGVVGTSPAASGVLGTSGGASAPASAETGVHGYAIQTASARGVHGQTTIGRGVFGQATSGVGVYARATTGFALRADGRVKVDRASGIATIGSGKTSVTVTPGLGVTSSSFVLLTPRTDPGARRLWCSTNPTANTFTIRVSTAVTADFRVGWLLLG